MRTIIDKNEYATISASKVGYSAKKKSTSAIKDTISTKEMNENVQIYDQCMYYWSALAEFRKRRKRARMYYRGDQWAEIITDPDTGFAISEENYIKNQGKIPFKQNMIRQMIKNLLGQQRTAASKPILIATNREGSEASDMVNNAIYAVHTLNMIGELDVRNFEEFLISGGCAGKVIRGYFPEKDRYDEAYENVNMNRLFFNSDIEDIRLRDLHTIGEIMDMTIDDIISSFAKTKKDEEKLRRHYNAYGEEGSTGVYRQGLKSDKLDALSFDTPSEGGTHRVIVVWQKKGMWKTRVHDYADGSYSITDYTNKEIDEINTQRLTDGVEAGLAPEEVPMLEVDDHYEEMWYVKYLSPWGLCLYEGETPYLHQEHPYILTLYPLLDGEVWGAVEDIIDQQRYINRLISLIDFIMGSSAKGVLLVPENVIHEDMDLDAIAHEWSKFNGVIKIKLKPGAQLPTQISANTTNVGAHELLAIQMRLIENIIGVSGAIQGQSAKSGTPSSLYAQEAQNSTINSKDLFDTFSTFKVRRDTKITKNIIQFWNEKRPILSSKPGENTTMFDPTVVKDLEYELVVAEGNNAPAYRQLLEDTLWKMLEGQMIDLTLYLENSSLPYAEKLLQSIKRRQSEGQEGGQGGAPDQEMLLAMQEATQGANQNANPDAMRMLEQMLGQPGSQY